MNVHNGCRDESIKKMVRSFLAFHPQVRICIRICTHFVCTKYVWSVKCLIETVIFLSSDKVVKVANEKPVHTWISRRRVIVSCTLEKSAKSS